MNETRWVDDFSEAWAREYPDAADTSGMLLIALLARLSVLIEAFEADTLAELDLLPSDYDVLASLRRVGSPYELAPNELYTALERSSGGMTKILKRLEALGLVERIPAERDRRSNLVRLTAQGLAVEEKAFRAFLSRTHEFLQSASTDELETINASVSSLLALIDDGFRHGRVL
jgi:DNA-binding MarR family transcriptional regulator